MAGRIKESRVRTFSSLCSTLLSAYELQRKHALGYDPDNIGEVARVFAQMVSASGQGFVPPGDNPVPAGSGEVQGGPRGPKELQDGDRETPPGD